VAAVGFSFGTKAETLASLAGRLRHGVVLPLDWFTVGEWQADEHAVLDRLCEHEWADGALIVRSSSLDEDTEAASNAGHFLSCAHVSGRGELRLAIEQVIRSYDGRIDTDADQVLVQPELDRVVASGVASSREPSGGGPYRVITYSEGAHTDAVTAGRDGTRSWYRLAYEDGAPPSPRLTGVPALIDELEQLADVPFELEFGVADEGPVVLFQVRPLAMNSKGVPKKAHRAAIKECRSQLRRLSRARPPALGPLGGFGVMPDWNPAEMIGLRPRPLATSLYRSLITDEIWAESRARYGYRDLRGVPLLVDFCGLPYIDARASFSSFVPAALDDATAERLVAHYMQALRARPHLHDKIESAIALTAYDFDTPARAQELVEHGVLSASQASDVVDALRALTVRMMGGDGPFARDLETAAELARLHVDGTPVAGFPLRRIAEQLDQCRALGTLPFAGLARAAFTAVGIVNSLVRQGVFTDEQGAALIGGANDVTKDLRRDFSTLDRDGFLDRYGHLRPGTYDIRSARYDESFERYFDPAHREEAGVEHAGFAPDAAQLEEIGRLIDSHGLACKPDALIDFVRSAIAARERSKLDFTRLVSQVLVDVRQLGEQLGFDADDMSYIPVTVLRRLAAGLDDVYAALIKAIRRGRERYRVTETLCAPALLRDEESFGSFVTMEDEPNFVTHARVIAPPADVVHGDELDGRIAMIASADPGWDWIFTHRIAGLITAFGGANSHMSLRALELELPAAIGVGEDRFRRWLGAPMLELDAANRLVRPLSAEPPVAAHAALRVAQSGSA
jgi:hypothetical protein